MLNDEKIVQIIPATGWRALYAEDDGTWTWTDLVCWALFENGDIQPIDTDRTGIVDGMCCGELSTFVGLYGPSEVPDDTKTAKVITDWRNKRKELKSTD